MMLRQKSLNFFDVADMHRIIIINNAKHVSAGGKKLSYAGCNA